MEQLQYHQWSYGIEWADIKLGMDKTRYHQGDLINCELYLKGNGNERSVNVLRIMLEATKVRTAGNGYTKAAGRKHLQTVEIDTAVDLDQHDPLLLPFTLQLPQSISFTDSTLCWSISVELKKGTGSIVSVTRHFQVLPQKILMEILATVESSLGFKENLHVRHWLEDSQKTRFLLEPDYRYKKHLDYVQLEIRETDTGDIEGQFEFDLQERVLTDYVKAILGKDKVHLPFLLKSEELFENTGSMNPEAVTLYFQNEIDRALNSREQRSLPQADEVF